MKSVFSLALLLLISSFFSQGVSASDGGLLMYLPSILGRPKVESIIGVSGGTLVLDTVSVTIPFNSFDDDTKVSLELAPARQIIQDEVVSDSYILSVSTQDIYEDLQMTISQTSLPNGAASVYLADSLDLDSKVVSAPPRIVDSQVSDGAVTFVIPKFKQRSGRSLGDRGSATNSGGAKFLAGAGPPADATVSTLFTVYAPTAADRIRIQSYANEAWGKLAAIFGQKTLESMMPSQIKIYTQKMTPLGEVALSIASKQDQYININKILLAPDKDDILKATIGHELFHVLQHMYDPRSSLEIRNNFLFDIHFTMLGEAFSVWFEARMLDSTTYVSDVFLERREQFVHGLESFQNVDSNIGIYAMNLGYCTSGFIRWLHDSTGDAMVKQTWQAVSAQATAEAYNDVSALISGAGALDTVNENWKEYIPKFITNTTGYTGWKEPTAGVLKWYSANNDLFEENITMDPFSGQRAHFIYNKIQPNMEYSITNLSQADSIAMELHKKPDKNSSYSLEARLNRMKPCTFTAAEGQQYVLTIASAGKEEPYTQTSSASFRLSPYDQPLICPKPPDGAPVSISYANPGGPVSNKQWTHPNDVNSTIIFERYYTDSLDTNTIQKAECYGYDDVIASGVLLHEYSWYPADEGGGIWTDYPYDENGFEHGNRKVYFSNGNLARLYPYVHGIMHGDELAYYESGSIKYKLPYLNGIKEGKAYFYYSNGNLQEMSTYENNYETGPCERYYEHNGNLESSGNLDSGQEDGLWTFYEDDGLTAYKECTYIYGALQGCTDL